MGKSQQLYKEARKIIPGGTQLFTKRPERMLPELWPAYYKKAKGCEVWDLDGKKYLDMSYMGIGACILGYADEDVNKAVKQAVDSGSMTTLNCPEEVELAKVLCGLHPWANMVRYARTGGEIVAIAVRIARAKTRKDIILFCGYHGWHDWYLSANLADDAALDGHLLPGLDAAGVPRALKGTAIPFEYNNIEKFQNLVKQYEGQIAAVIMEPKRFDEPKAGFLQAIRDYTKKNNIVLIFDEITAAWRSALGGVHLTLGVEPDLAVFAKATSNGYPMAAIIGRSSVMDAVQETFVSSAYWTEKIGPAAALATIRKFKKQSVPQALAASGKMIQEGWKNIAKKNKLEIKVIGPYPLGVFSFNCADQLMVRTLLTQLMLERNFLATNAIFVSLAHTPKVIQQYLGALDESFGIIAKALKEDNVKKHLKGPVCHSDFRRLV